MVVGLVCCCDLGRNAITLGTEGPGLERRVRTAGRNARSGSMLARSGRTVLWSLRTVLWSQ